MNILLVQLPTSHLGARERVYPLGLSRLSSLVPPRAVKFVLDMNIAVDPWLALKERLEKTTPNLVALSFRNLDLLAGHQTSYLESLVTAARLVRCLCPASRIIAGGPAFSLFPERLMQAVPEIDAGLIGEGEMIFSRLLDPAVSPATIPGLIWRSNGCLHSNQAGAQLPLANLPDLDLQEFAPADYLNRNNYVAAFGIEGKRGCDLHCAYCIYPCLGGQRMRLRPPNDIADEIENLNKDWGAHLFHFTDGVVNRPSDHFDAVCREILRRRLDVNWTGFFREDHLTLPQLELAKAAGLTAVYLSADALTDHGLKILQKQMRCDDILRAAHMTVECELLTVCHFLVNLPGETRIDAVRAREMLERILEIHAPAGNLGAVIFNTVRLYPGAPITRRLIRSKVLDPATDLLYPVYFNPSRHAELRYELETICHTAGTFSRLSIPALTRENAP